MIKTDRKGFTLVELLAVIVILAIIMIIATMNVGKVITRSRTQSFESNMDLAVKNAKRILDTGDTLTTEKLRESLGYSANEYDFDVKKVPDGYLLQLISTSTGKFKNVDFSTISKNNNYIYEENVKGENGRNKIGLKISIDGNTVNITEDSIEEKIVKEELPDGCTNFTKKDTYEVGDIISFCNYYAEGNGKSEDFYVIKDNGDTVTAISKNPLDFNDNDGKIQTKETRNADKDCSTSYLRTINKNCRTFTVYKAIAAKEGIITQYINYGYWVNNKFNCYGYSGNYGVNFACNNTGVNDNYEVEVQGRNYPAYVYDGNSYTKKYVDEYINNLKMSYYVDNVEGRLIKYSELQALGCDATTCKNSGKPWIYSVNYLTGSASSYNSTYSVLSSGTLYGGNGTGTIRPVITISKSEL